MACNVTMYVFNQACKFNNNLWYSSATRQNWRVESTYVACKFLTNQLTSVLLLLASIIVKYMDIISRVLAQHTSGNLIDHVDWNI